MSLESTPHHRRALVDPDSVHREVHEMAVAVMALALELPPSVHEDVCRRWDAALEHLGASAYDVRRAWAEWCVDIGYPFDVTTPEHVIPEDMRRPLAEAWFRRDGHENETVDEWEWSCAEDGGWSK